MRAARAPGARTAAVAALLVHQACTAPARTRGSLQQRLQARRQRVSPLVRLSLQAEQLLVPLVPGLPCQGPQRGGLDQEAQGCCRLWVVLDLVQRRQRPATAAAGATGCCPP